MENEVHNVQFETVLVMQGGGSLGAYECGVYKALERHEIKFDIVAGTSIGAVNAGIIAGSKSGQPTKDLEDFWLHIAEYVTLRSNATCLFVSLEMARLELAQRLLCSLGNIDGNKFRSGFVSSNERDKLVQASNKLSRAPLFIDDTPSRTVTEIAACARRLKRRKALGLLIIDYLQLIHPDNPKDPRQEQVAKIAR